MKLKALWDKVCFYPDKLMYYDKSKNEQDTITVTYEMDNFCNDNADKKLLNYEIDFANSILWVEFDSGKKKEEKRYE